MLIVIAILPWLSSFMESFKFGKEGIEAVFKKIEEVKQEIKTEVRIEAAETAQRIDEIKEISNVNQTLNTFGAGGGKTSSEATESSLKTTETFENEVDPQKGKWGGKAIDPATHRKLSVEVKSLPNNDFLRRLILRVESTDPNNYPLTDNVIFHLHPTFRKQIVEVQPVNNAAELSLVAYGAFTVGAVTDGGKTKLEFDIAELGKNSDDPFYYR